MDHKESSIKIQPLNYKESIKAGKRFYLQFAVFNHEVEAVFTKMLHRYLERHDILYLKDMLFTVIRELISNAVKANTKRLYFRLNSLNIKEKNDYRKGMETFKDQVYVEENDILQELQKVNLRVRVSFESSSENLIINVLNNTPILKEELAKIEARVKKAYVYNDISEAFIDVLDDSEGAGLGLIIALMLLKNTGFPQESFKLDTENQITTATIKLPKKNEEEEYKNIIADEILREVDNIPSFPENILEIQRLCHKPDSTIKEISESIKRDPGLTTSVLKLANSAGYITLNKTRTIEEAVKLIGLKSISTLLVASGVQEIMDSRYKKFEDIWTNSYKAAFYAQRLSLELKKTKLSEFVYLSALLADIGMITLLSIKPELTNRIQEIAGIKAINNSNILEEISLGISHSTLGSIICKKWKFNEALIKVLEYHHRPHMSPTKYKELIYIVYLAYAFIEIENKKTKFLNLDEDVLEFCKLNDQKQFESLHETLKQAYDKHYMAERA